MPAKVISHNDGRSTNYVIEGPDQGSIEEAIERIERNYHPWGYGTSFQPPKQKPDGSWSAYGSRANSCD